MEARRYLRYLWLALIFAPLPASGETVRIYVTSNRAIGKYTVFKILKKAAPIRIDGCLMPGSFKPVVCPSA